MSMIAFLRRLTGTSSEGLAEQRRFDQNICSVQEQGEELDRLQVSMDAVIERVVLTQRKIAASSHPSSYSGEHKLSLPLIPGAPNGPATNNGSR